MFRIVLSSLRMKRRHLTLCWWIDRLAEFKYGGMPKETFAPILGSQDKPNMLYYYLKKVRLRPKDTPNPEVRRRVAERQD